MHSSIRCGACIASGRRLCDLDEALKMCTGCANRKLKCDYYQKLQHSRKDKPLKAIYATIEPTKIERLEYLLNKIKQSPPPPPATTHNATPPYNLLFDSNYELLSGTDFGTLNSSTSFKITRTNATLRPDQPFITTKILVQGSFRLPTQASVVEDGAGGFCLTFKNDEDSAHDVERNEVFRFPKLHLIPRGEMETMGYKGFVRDVQCRNEALLAKLEHEKRLPAHIQSMTDVLLETLRHLYRTIKDGIKNESGMTEEQVNWILRYKTRFVVACPALYPDYVVAKFQSLLVQAGFTQPEIRGEPKLSLAIHAHEQEVQLPLSQDGEVDTTTVQGLRSLVGLTLVLVDIGCGTTDISQMVLTGLYPKMTFKAVAVGTGSLSGSQLLNQYCKESIRALLGDHLAVCAKACSYSEEDILDMFELGFERPKRKFSSENTTPMKIYLPHGSKQLPISDRLPELAPTFIKLNKKQLQAIFDRYIAELIKPIQAQLDLVNGSPGAWPVLVFSGGGSLIPYIQEKMKKQFEGRYPIKFPNDADRSTVAEGAVLAAQDPEIGTRSFARTGYGVCQNMEYNPELHAETEAIDAPDYLNYSSQKQVEGCYFPVIKPGESVAGAGMEGWLEINESDLSINKDGTRWFNIRTDIYQPATDKLAKKKDWKAGDQVKYAYKLGMNIRNDQLKVRPVEGVYTISYRAVPMWDGLCLRWFMVVHPNGYFPEKDYEDYHYVKGCFVAEIEMKDAQVRQDDEE